MSEQHALPPFSHLAVEGFADVTLVQGPAEAVRVEAASKQLSSMRAKVSEGTLTITTGAARSW